MVPRRVGTIRGSGGAPFELDEREVMRYRMMAEQARAAEADPANVTVAAGPERYNPGKARPCIHDRHAAWREGTHAAHRYAILVLVFGPALLALSPVVALVGWARVQAGDHTVAQVAVGAVVGGAVAAAVFSLLC